MDKFKTLSLFLAILLSVQTAAVAQSGKAADKLKKYINNMVEKVEAAEHPEQKRKIMNKTFSDMITTFERVEKMKSLSEADRSAVAGLKADIFSKKEELNGRNGFDRVKNNELNNFANYVQQDMEQADEYVTISVSLLVLIGLILLLL